jgi:hypothetical protein
VRNLSQLVLNFSPSFRLLFLLGIILEYELRDHSREMKEIDLLHLTPEYVLNSQESFFFLHLMFW